MLIKNRAVADLADSIAFQGKTIDLNGPLENFSEYDQTLKLFSKTYQDYFISSLVIDQELGIAEASMEKHEIFREHYNRENKENKENKDDTTPS